MKVKIFVVLITVLALNFAMTPSVNADPYVVICYVTGVETDLDGEVRIDLALVSNGNTRTHVVPTGQEKSMMAVALTAMVSDLRVRAFVDFWITDSEIGYIKIIVD